MKASIEGVSEAAASVKNMPADYRVSITNAPGNAYPISSFTWLLIPQPPKDPANGKVLIDFLKWMLQHQNEASSLIMLRFLLRSRRRSAPPSTTSNKSWITSGRVVVCLMLFWPGSDLFLWSAQHNLFHFKRFGRGWFNLKFTKARYGMSGEIRDSGAASGWPG